MAEAVERTEAASPGWAVFAAVVGREMRENTESFRCHVAVALIVAVMGLAALAYGMRYRSEIREYAATLADYGTGLEGVTVDQLVELPHPAVKPPWRLAFVVDGGQLRTPNLYRQALSAWVEPEVVRAYGGSHRGHGAEALDWLFVIRVVLSLAAFAVAYDAICGHRQRASLKVLLSYPLARWQVLSAKLAAAWCCLALPFVGGSLLSLLIMTAYGGLRPGPGELGKIALVVLLGLWAIAFFLLVALLISSLSRESTASLAVLALIWVVAVEVVPAASGLLAHALHPVPTDMEVARRMAEIRRQVEAERGGPGSWRAPEWAAADDFAWERASAAIQNRRYALQEDERRAVLRRKLAQTELARDFASVSPSCLIQDLAERLVGSGSGRDRSFYEQVWAFGDHLAAWATEADRRDPESPHVLFFSRYLSQRPVDAEAVPRFAFAERSLAVGLETALPRLGGLALITLLALAAVLYGFERFDVG